MEGLFAVRACWDRGAHRPLRVPGRVGDLMGSVGGARSGAQHELAVAGGGEAIITKNVRDLRRAELLFPQIRVLRPEEVVKEVEA